MARLRTVLSRVLALFGKGRRDAELNDEIQAHLDLLIEEHVRRGMSLKEARAAARREFGGVEQVKETYRDQRGLPFVEAIGQDLRYAFRTIGRAPGFAAVVVLTFALGIGATTAVFTVVNNVLVRELPYPNARRLVQIVQTLPQRDDGRPPTRAVGITPEQVYVLRGQTRTLWQVGFFRTASGTLVAAGKPARVSGGRVSAGFFETFGVQPAKGRTFTVEDEWPGAPRIVILSHRIWTESLGQDPEIVGKSLSFDDVAYRVVGVMPDGFNVPTLGLNAITRTDAGRLEDAPAFWMPVTLAPPTGQRSSGFSLFPSIAALAEGVSAEQATAELNSIIPPFPTGARPTKVEVISLRDQMAESVRPGLMAFQVAVVFVLLIACANVANLLLARATHRRRELAIRLALGASRLQASRGAVAECAVLAIAGGLLGCLIALGAVAILQTLPPGVVPRLRDIRVDTATIGFALAVSLTAGAIVGAFVAARVLRRKVWASLHEVGAATLSMRSRPLPILVVGQVAAALALLVGAGLFFNSFVRLASRALGFDVRNVLTLEVALPASRYPQGGQQMLLYSPLVQALSELPNVTGVAAGDAPFQGSAIGFYPVLIAGKPEEGEVAYRSVMPGYFATWRVPLLKGREFSSADDASGPKAILVSQAFASRYFGSGNPLGQEVQVVNEPPARIVGVVPDIAHGFGALRDAPRPEVYFPAVQLALNQRIGMTIALRSTRNPLELVPAVRATVAALDPALAIHNVATVEQRLAESLAESRLYSTGAIVSAAIGLLLAIIGLYGVMSYSVSSRMQEFGVRVALGADPDVVVRQVVRQGLGLAIAGLVIGLVGAVLTTRSLEKLLFGIKPTDPSTLVGVTILFLVAACVACYLPARRASRVDPMVALRHE